MRQQKYGTRFPQRSTPHARSTVERDIFGVEARLPSLHSNPLPSSYALLHGMVGRINSAWKTKHIPQKPTIKNAKTPSPCKSSDLFSLSLSLSSPAPHPPSARVWPSVRLAALEARELREAPHLGAAEASVAVAVQGGEDRGLQVVAAPEVRANRPAAPVRWCVRW